MKNFLNKLFLFIILSINISFLNVRTGPGMKFDIINVLKEGDKIIILGDKFKNWIKIGFSMNEGWVAEKYINRERILSKKKYDFITKDNLIRDIYNHNSKLNLSFRLII